MVQVLVSDLGLMNGTVPQLIAGLAPELSRHWQKIHVGSNNRSRTDLEVAYRGAAKQRISQRQKLLSEANRIQTELAKLEAFSFLPLPDQQDGFPRHVELALQVANSSLQALQKRLNTPDAIEGMERILAERWADLKRQEVELLQTEQKERDTLAQHYLVASNAKRVSFLKERLDLVEHQEERDGGKRVISQRELLNLLRTGIQRPRLWVLNAPPKISSDCPEDFEENLTMELEGELPWFMEQFFPPNDSKAPVETFGRFFDKPISDPEAKQLELELEGLPILIFYTAISDRKVSLRFRFRDGDVSLHHTFFWDWRAAFDKLVDEGHTEKHALRQIRDEICNTHQWLAAAMADAYYLGQNPLHEVRCAIIAKSAKNLPEDKHLTYDVRSLQQTIQEAYFKHLEEVEHVENAPEEAVVEVKVETPKPQEVPSVKVLIPELAVESAVEPVAKPVSLPEPESREVTMVKMKGEEKTEAKAEVKGKGYVVKGKVEQVEVKEEDKAKVEPVPQAEAPLPTELYTWENSLGIEFVYVAPGAFIMGDEHGDSDAKPEHRVEITKGFWMSRTPITQAQWKAVIQSNPSHFVGDTLPVDSVTFDDVQGFMQRINMMEGTNAYRLPTEAEWEFSCRAGSQGTYCFGKDVKELEAYAWYDKNAESMTHPVAQKKPNAWGLYDMHGNIWEWVADVYEANWYQEAPLRDPVNQHHKRFSLGGTKRVLRGGSWIDIYNNLASGFRYRARPNLRDFIFGFRLLREE